ALEEGQAHTEERQTRSEMKQESMDSKLDFLVSSVKSGASALSALAPSTPREEKPRTNPANPLPNPDHQALGMLIQGRRNHDKALEHFPSQFVSQAQTLSQNTVKSQLEIEKVTCDPPLFYYKDGQPDFFPVQFTRNGYCKPYFHWDKPFADNYPCFTTYIDAFRKSVPKDGSAFAKVAMEFTDRQILVLFHNGAFSSLVTAYKNENPKTKGCQHKTSTEEKMKKREVSRLDRKTFLRGSYQGDAQVKPVAGPRWNVGWSKQVMSPVITDTKGGQIVQQPEWRAGWWTNVLLAMDNADWAMVLAKPGIHPPLPKSTTVIVPGPPPTIYMGKGEDKKIVKIPLVLISRKWRKDPINVAWMEASESLIDSTMTRKPDLSAFISAHPAPVEPDQTKANDNVDYKRGNEGEGQGDFKGEYDGEDEDEDEGKGRGKGKGGGEGKGEDKGVDRMDRGGFAGAQAEAEYSSFRAQGLVSNLGLEQMVKGNHDDLYAPNPAPVPAPAPTIPLCTQAPASQEPEGSQVG
ncbi:hypothetical protein FRC11_001490, partial [Ceratobasidium sp. 423]